MSGFAEHLHTLSRVRRHPARTRREIDQFRDRKLRFLIEHAWANVAFLREKLEAAGVHPSRVRAAADLALLPTTTKREMTARPVRELVARGVDPDSLVSRYTAGSTGDPVRVRRTPFEDFVLNSFRWRARSLLGVKVSDRIAFVTAPGVPTNREPRWPGRVRDALGIYRSTLVDCLRQPEEIAADLVRLQPDVLIGYASSLVEVIEPWRSDGRGRAPRLVLCGGDTMTPSMRQRLRAGFGARVYETYGCYEMNVLGWECEATGDLHVCDDGAIVELLKDGRPVGPGESGEVVVTNLHAYALPYLRYELGDMAVAGEDACACGSPFRTLRGIQGRRMDLLVLPDGRVMHHWELIPMSFWDLPWHRQYQLVQEAPDRIVLRVIVDSEPPAADLEHLHRSVLEKLGPGAQFRIERIDELERARSGKWRACVSLVDRG